MNAAYQNSLCVFHLINIYSSKICSVFKSYLNFNLYFSSTCRFEKKHLSVLKHFANLQIYAIQVLNQANFWAAM